MTTRKKVCITINSLSRGGAEKQCLLLAKALKPYHDVILVILNPQPTYPARLAVLEEENINHLYLSKNPIKRITQFISLLKQKKTEIIFSFLPTDTVLSAICGKLAGVHYILGGIRNSYLPRVKFAALKFIHNYILDYTIANNYAAYYAARKFGFQENVMVIPNGIEIRPLKRNSSREDDVITIISLGRLVKQKEYEVALKSISNLKKRLKDGMRLKYRIVGQGPLEESISKSIQKYEIGEMVDLITDPSDIYALLESSHIYLCTSSFEGISNAIMEAMNCALPIVATDAGDNSYLVIEGKNGFLAPIGNHLHIANQLYRLIESPSMRHQMGLESYNYLGENYGYRAYQKKYLNLINNIDEIRINEGNFVSEEM